MAGLLGMSVSEAKQSIPSHEFASWLEHLRRKKNEPSVPNMYLHDLTFYMYQLWRSWTTGLPAVDYKEFRKEVVFGKVKKAEKNALQVQPVEQQKAVFAGWLGVNLGNQVMSS